MPDKPLSAAEALRAAQAQPRPLFYRQLAEEILDGISKFPENVEPSAAVEAVAQIIARRLTPVGIPGTLRSIDVGSRAEKPL